MIRIEGRYLFRGGTRIGSIGEGRVTDHVGERVGYYTDDHVCDKDNRKIAYIEGDYIHFIDSSRKIRIEDNNKDMEGGSLSNVEKAAVRILLGD
jgi:hypothetical protein